LKKLDKVNEGKGIDGYRTMEYRRKPARHKIEPSRLLIPRCWMKNITIAVAQDGSA
jgi:hypothetical protein